MRNSFAQQLDSAASKDSSIRLLVGDIGFRIFDTFRDNHPDKFLNCGIAEQNMIGVAAGMASEGLKPVVYTIIPFLVMRAFEQIRVDIGINNTNVILVGVGAGLAYDKLGPTHHAYEDLALMRSISSLNIYLPYDGPSTKSCLNDALAQQDIGSASYIRLSKGGEPDIPCIERLNQSIDLIRVGNLSKIVVTHGYILSSVLDQVKAAESDYCIYALKKFDTPAIDSFLFRASSSGVMPTIIVVEEAYRRGSLYSEIAMRAHELSITIFLKGCHIDHQYLFEIDERESLIKKYMGIEEVVV
jgi:transketolase